MTQIRSKFVILPEEVDDLNFVKMTNKYIPGTLIKNVNISLLVAISSNVFYSLYSDHLIKTRKIIVRKTDRYVQN